MNCRESRGCLWPQSGPGRAGDGAGSGPIFWPSGSRRRGGCRSGDWVHSSFQRAGICMSVARGDPVGWRRGYIAITGDWARRSERIGMWITCANGPPGATPGYGLAQSGWSAPGRLLSAGCPMRPSSCQVSARPIVTARPTWSISRRCPMRSGSSAFWEPGDGKR